MTPTPQYGVPDVIAPLQVEETRVGRFVIAVARAESCIRKGAMALFSLREKIGGN